MIGRIITSIIGGSPVINKGLEIIDKRVEDKDLKATLISEFNKLALLHKSVFVTVLLAGPKPALMWIAAGGFFMHYIANPILHIFGLPILELQVQDLYALAGLGGASIFARSWEKVKKATGNH